jgi:cysteinyl-tRNA synthetase
MSITLYNSLTRSREPLDPVRPGRVAVYACGPTVYDFAHIGNWRANVFVDLLHRYLEYRGLEVELVMNLTDVDDKTIAGARREEIGLRDYTDRYIEAFFEDSDRLGIRRADHYPRATDHISQMLTLITALSEHGLTYEAGGSVYYAVDRFEGYGRLSRVDTSGLRAGARVDADEYEKEEVRDFVLWKGRKEEDGDVWWDSPWGPGRPGWHLECSAMSMEYLGVPFDIHTGGVDLQFPHHENEIAQSQGATGQMPANCWLHNEHLLVEGRKMSKSLGNFLTLRDLIEEGADPMAVRYLLLATHYRQQLNFKREGLAAAGAGIARLREAARLWRERAAGEGERGALLDKAEDAAESAAGAFTSAMDADLNISEGLSAVYEFVRSGNALLAEGLGPGGAGVLLAVLEGFDSVLGVVEEDADEEALSPEQQQMITSREHARASRDWAEADRIRDALIAQGILVEDTPEGSRWKRTD